MSEATTPLPALGATGLMAVTQQAIAEIRTTQELTRQAIARRGPLVELTESLMRLAELEDTIRRGSELAAVDEVLNTPALAVVPEPARRARHRRPSRQRAQGEHPLMRPVKGVVPLGGFGGWLANHALAATAATAGTAATVVVASAALGGPHLPGIPHGGSAATAPNPAASIYSAVPISSWPSSQLIAQTVTHPKGVKGVLDAKSSRADVDVVVPPVFPLVTPSVSPSASPSPSVSSSSVPPSSAPVTVQAAAPPPPPVPQLVVAESSVDVSSGQPASIQVTATGGAFVPFDVDSSTPDIQMSATITRLDGDTVNVGNRLEGWLVPGETLTLTFTPAPAAVRDGAQSVTVNLGRAAAGPVTVVLVDPPAPSVSPSAVTSLLPAPNPSAT